MAASAPPPVHVGKVWLVGAGPGDPDLITVRGRDLLEQADTVLYDALSHPALLAYCRVGADLRNVGKRGGTQSPDQTWITQQLVELARSGKRVVRLKGGDSFLFARGAEEAEALAEAGIEFEVVPGLSSPVATSAYAGIPLTHRELSSSVTFITGSDRAGEAWSDVAWKKLATATDTLCILMGMRRLREITQAIQEGGRGPETPVAVIQWGARPEQRVLVSTLAAVAEDVKAQGFANPAVVVVGEVVRLREQLAWFERSPLFGKRVLIPRAEHQAALTAKAVRRWSADPVVLPVIEMVEPPDRAPLERAVARLQSYQWVLFTSQNGVERFFAELSRQGGDTRRLGNAHIGAIGQKTAAALERHSIRADLVATEFIGEALARELIEKHEGTPGRVLVPRALVARDALPEALRKHGFEVDVVAAYETRGVAREKREALCAAFEDGRIDAALFTSSSTVENTVAALGEKAGELLGRVAVASIGPVTSGTLQRLGVRCDVTAAVYTVDGLLEALGRFYSDHRALER
jgi:uroporphyrinogen III methyltransferase / synthase